MDRVKGEESMKKSRIVLLVVLMVTLLSGTINSIYAYDNLNETIRVGLYFEKSAVLSVDIGSKTGFQMGYERDGEFIPIMLETDVQNVVVRKDVYYVKTADGFVQYWPDSDVKKAGTKYGPHHIQIGQSYTNYNKIKSEIDSLNRKGLNTYIMFADDAYKIWTGLYPSKEEAEEDISHISEVSGESCNVIALSAKRVQVIDSSTNEVKMMFDSASSFLQIRPIEREGEVPTISVNGRLYRGAVEFKRFSDSDMTVINVVDLEEYLYGILPREMGGSWPLEALKAQAVSARTYTIINMNKHNAYGFNLCTTEHCHVYGGFQDEHPTSTQAVEETRGQLLLYNGKPASTYYFSTSGGHTEDVRNVWGGSGYPYLSGVEDTYEPTERSERGIWEIEMTPQKAQEIFKAKGYDLGQILSMTVLERSDSGRVIKLKVIGTKDEHIFERSMTRNVFGARFVNSQMYTITTDSDFYIKGKEEIESTMKTTTNVKVLSASGVSTFSTSQGRIYAKGNDTKKSYAVIPSIYVFSGKGFGHGVGMSQWGARGMAEEGFGYDEILTHYYPGTVVE